MQKITLALDANNYSAETCKLSTNCYGAELRVYFFKGYHQERICENISKKGQKAKNSTAGSRITMVDGGGRFRHEEEDADCELGMSANSTTCYQF